MKRSEIRNELLAWANGGLRSDRTPPSGYDSELLAEAVAYELGAYNCSDDRARELAIEAIESFVASDDCEQYLEDRDDDDNDDDAACVYVLVQSDREINLGTYTSYDAALAAACDYAGPDGVVGHDGDLSDGGDRTLIWADEESAEDDDGQRAIASIRKGL